jgi:phage gp37-like protein
MITEIQNDIIDRLKEITSVNTVDAWQGNVEELIRSPQKMPALLVIYQGAVYEESKVIGATIAPHEMSFLIAVFDKNLRGRKEGSEGCYSIIESVRAKLIKYKVLNYGYLWPVREELITIAAGTFVYGLEYKIRTTA